MEFRQRSEWIVTVNFWSVRILDGHRLMPSAPWINARRTCARARFWCGPDRVGRPASSRTSSAVPAFRQCLRRFLSQTTRPLEHFLLPPLFAAPTDQIVTVTGVYYGHGRCISTGGLRLSEAFSRLLKVPSQYNVNREHARRATSNSRESVVVALHGRPAIRPALALSPPFY